MVATLARIFGVEHLDAIEDAVQDALVQALKRWPFEGEPANPSAWLTQVAKNRLLDRLRRGQRWERKRDELERLVAQSEEIPASGDARFSEELRDDTLGAIFACCHPAIPGPSRVALTLRVVGGFSLAEIARAFLAREDAVSQRVLRARNRLKELGAPVELPPPEELPHRLDSALEVLYLMFNEGYSALAGDDLVRTDLCHEAIRLAELLAEHPRVRTPPVHALAALLLFHASRLSARSDAAQELLLLDEQDRSLWDRGMIRRGLEHFGHSARGDELTQYHLEAEIASCHALAPTLADTDWARVVASYDTLLSRHPSPVVALNRAIGVAYLEGPASGLQEIEALRQDRLLQGYHPLHTARGEILRRLGRHAEAAAAYRKALGLTSSEPVRRFVARRLAEVESAGQLSPGAEGEGEAS